jgi:hypothetical protein
LPAKNAFEVNQGLNWRASRSRMLEDQFERPAQVHRLMSSLLGDWPDSPYHRALPGFVWVGLDLLDLEARVAGRNIEGRFRQTI